MLWVRANPRPLRPTNMGGPQEAKLSQICSNSKNKKVTVCGGGGWGPTTEWRKFRETGHPLYTRQSLSSTLQKVLRQICPADLSCSDCHVGWPLAWPLVNCNCAQIYDGGGPERKWPCEIWFCFIVKAKSKCLKPWCFITQNYTIHQDISLRGMNAVVNI